MTLFETFDYLYSFPYFISLFLFLYFQNIHYPENYKEKKSIFGKVWNNYLHLDFDLLILINFKLLYKNSIRKFLIQFSFKIYSF